MEIDWTPIIKHYEDEVECFCGAIYMSHSKGVASAESFTIVTLKPCPACGRTQDHVRRASSTPEHLLL